MSHLSEHHVGDPGPDVGSEKIDFLSLGQANSSLISVFFVKAVATGQANSVYMVSV